MNRFFRTIFLLFPAFTLTSILMLNHTAAEPAPSGPSESHSDLVCVLEVSGNTCYAFLQPDPQSEYFGPLEKGEKLKWLDSRGDWIRIWIPRLMASGWILRINAFETTETMPTPANIPDDLLTTVTIISNQANLREAPTTSSNIITTVQKDQEFWLVNKKSNWHQIWHFGLKRRGWISGELITTSRKETP